MIGESELARNQQNSNAHQKIAMPREAEAKKIVINESKSTHVADPFLQRFLSPTFDPADYLNSSLPSLNRSKTSVSNQNSVSLTELFPIAQNLVSQVSAHTTRLTATLTQLTDEILRSGSRLTYEVEILRENTLNLSEALTKVIHDDFTKLVPGSSDNELDGIEALKGLNVTPNTNFQPWEEQEPEYVQKIRILTLVRSRLEKVVRTFGDAMEWSFPPSEVSTASSFLSVSGPHTGSGIHGCSTEEKGQKVSKEIRNEISRFLNSNDPISGIEAAAKKVEELKELVMVWKGTAEERARLKFIESLAKMVEDRHRDLLRETEQDLPLHRAAKMAYEVIDEAEESKPLSGYGFMSQLQKLRGP